MEIGLILTGGLVISLPLMWLNNKYSRYVEKDKVVAWLMLMILLVLGGLSVWAQDLADSTYKLNALRSGSYVLAYGSYWVVVRLRKLDDRFNFIHVVLSAVFGVAVLFVLSQLLS